MDMLSCLISLLQENQLQMLDEAKFPWLPRVRDKRSPWIIKVVRGALEACRIPDERLKRIAWFYCWLVPLHVLRPWTLFHLSVAAVVSNEFTILDRLASALKILGRETTFVATDGGTAIRGCILVADAVPVSVKHDVVCVCLWRQLPFMAVYAPAVTVHSQLSVALAAVLDCNPEHIVRGLYGDLSAAYAAALGNAAALSAGAERSNCKVYKD